ncbi:RecQ family ATP-dependent DNA helicase [Mycolicibacterium grossiae]|uniref:ATP-dependent DNA helicase RecQ n=1 Tax=Mycolicibacterium grossiae TaxID=1552759 RepID=A0A1E8QA16_9MYCO|nr:RecQ family ATP-dependent DNA helicase [Mycolicibacterium grossiae]OFJ55423.1 recombinase RecQ [Mycolicibacterium grossiae]
MVDDETRAQATEPDAPADEQLCDVARRVFGWEELHPEQLQAMSALVAGRDVLAVLPTGSGKSAIYQVPAVLLDGVTLVVSPLIALQADQIAGLTDTGDLDAVAIHSAQRATQRKASWKALREGTADYVFVSPEQLANDEVVAALAEVPVSLVVVDEAHCVSAWGHDFRPDYLRLADAFATVAPKAPVVALTATASGVVRREIVERLRLEDAELVIGGFDRPNLRLEARQFVDDADKRRDVVDTVAGLDGPGLLYAATRKDAERYATDLAERGLRAAVYHAGLDAARRSEVHDAFRHGGQEGGDETYDVVVATSAFGMGIDKPNVRYVVHASVPDSLDSYYQQIGRAGRDGDEALALLFYRAEDLGLARFFTTHRPDEELLDAVYRVLDADEPTRIGRLRDALDVRGRKLTNAVNLLEEAGAVTATRKGLLTSGQEPAEAVRAAVEVVEQRERVDQSRVEMMRGYAETRHCRRQFLLTYFGDELEDPCGNCDRCSAVDDLADADGDHPAIPVDTAVSHTTWGPGVVIGGDTDRITVLFDDVGYRTLAMKAVEENHLLTTR